jgi:hypothetical protein
LPLEVTALGVGEDEDLDPGRMWDEDHAEILSLQAELFALAGPPDTEALRAAYQGHADDAEMMVKYYREIIAHPERGSAGSQIEWRKEALADHIEEHRFYCALLAELDAHQLD